MLPELEGWAVGHPARQTSQKDLLHVRELKFTEQWQGAPKGKLGCYKSCTHKGKQCQQQCLPKSSSAVELLDPSTTSKQSAPGIIQGLHLCNASAFATRSSQRHGPSSNDSASLLSSCLSYLVIAVLLQTHNLLSSPLEAVPQAAANGQPHLHVCNMQTLTGCMSHLVVRPTKK